MLTAQQDRLLHLVYQYQNKFDRQKLVVGRYDGKLLDVDPQTNLAIDVLGREAQGNEFEMLMDNMPPEYVRFFPETRFDNPYVVAVTDAARSYLSQKGIVDALSHQFFGGL